MPFLLLIAYSPLKKPCRVPPVTILSSHLDLLRLLYEYEIAGDNIGPESCRRHHLDERDRDLRRKFGAYLMPTW